MTLFRFKSTNSTINLNLNIVMFFLLHIMFGPDNENLKGNGI